jgi:hypothetical protein
LFTGPGPTRHDRHVMPSARHDPYKNNRAGPGLRQSAHGPGRSGTILNRAGLGLVPLVPCRFWTGGSRADTARPVGHVYSNTHDNNHSVSKIVFVLALFYICIQMDGHESIHISNII